MANDLGADLDQFFAQAGQRPGFSRLEHRQRSHEVAEVVGQRMKLEADGVGGEGAALQPGPFDCPLAFFDPLLCRAALVVEGDDALGRPCQALVTQGLQFLARRLRPQGTSVGGI